MSYLFLFREKDSDDRDCCAYIDSKNPRFECNHYFGSVNLNGACYTGHEFPAYEDIETVLTKAEYNELVQFNKAINDLGYGITKGDERYNKGIALAKAVQHIYGKLESEEAKEFQQKIIESEIEYMKDEYSLDDADIEKILSLEPDLVLASTHFSDDAVKQLEDAGVPVLYLYDEGDMEGVYDMISLVGEAVNCAEAAEKQRRWLPET